MQDDRASRADGRGPGASRLADAVSLYLRQHADDPVEWYPWSEEALARARAEDRPIFLSIGYSSCHWCHVMEREVFSDRTVAELLNETFVCIKVDREERPDIDAVYMDAVQLITGRGGWPLSVFLTPAARPFFGGTYFPRESFIELLQKIVQVFRENRDEVESQAAQLAERAVGLPSFFEKLRRQGPPPPLDERLIENAAAQAPPNFDTKWGGFTGEQKFPTPVRWLFLLHHHRRTGDRRSANMVRLTLEAMASGGIYDHVGGGFHRYAVEPTWTVPHFEKMLYDNAQLAALYLEAGVALQRADFLAVGKDVLDFLLRDMSDPEGGFYGSLDADSEGREGSYYLWSTEDLTLATSAADGPALAALLGVDGQGAVEGSDRSVLTRRADPRKVAEDLGRDPDETAVLFNRHREALRAYRARREPPTLDRKLITSWNGLAIGAMTSGHAVTGESRYLEAAQRAADAVWRRNRDGQGRLRRASEGGRAEGDAVLADYSFLACAMMDLFQATGAAEYLERAVGLVDHARVHFAGEGGGWTMTPEGGGAPLGRKVVLFDSVTPAGSSALMHALLRLASLTGRSELRQDAERSLQTFAHLLDRAGLEMSWWVDAVLRFQAGMREVVIAGDPEAGPTRDLRAAVGRLLAPHVVVVPVPADGPAAELARLAPPAAGKRALESPATAYVCEHGTCQRPTGDAAEMVRQVMEGWSV